MKSSLFTFCHLTRKSDQKTCLCRWCPQDQDPRLMLLLKSQNVNALLITAKYYNAKIWPFIVFIDNCVQRNVSSQRHCVSYTWRMIILLFFGTPIISWTHIFLQTQNLQKAPIFVAACITALLIFVPTNEDVESKSMNAMHASSGMLTTLLWQCPM